MFRIWLLLGTAMSPDDQCPWSRIHITVVEPTTQLVCNPHTPAALAIINVTNLKIANIAFSGCGRALRNGIWDRAMNDFLTPIFPPADLRPPAAIFMSKIRNAVIESVLVQNSTGYGLIGINILGNSYIHNSTFLHNNDHATDEGGNAFLVYMSTKECEKKQFLQDFESEKLSISSTQFMFGLGRGFPPTYNSHYQLNSYIGGGGLTIMTTTADFRINVDIQDIVAAYNSVLFEADGINLWIIIHRQTNLLFVQITNLTSMHGKHLNATPFGSSNSFGCSIVKFTHNWCVRDDLPTFTSVSIKNSFFSHNSVAINIIVHIPRRAIKFILQNCSFSDNEAHLQFAVFEQSYFKNVKYLPVLLLDNCNFSRSKSNIIGLTASIFTQHM